VRRFGAIVLVAAAVASVAAAAPARTPTWPEVAAGLRPALDRKSANPCQRGDLSCLDIVIAAMQRRDAAQAASCDHRAFFTRLYLRTTQALRDAVRAGRFHSGPAIVHFAAWFARLGLQAEDAWQSGHLADVPGAWQVAFSAEAARRVRSMGDLLLGMNAHISRDLAFVVANVEHGRGTAIDPDFALFTDVIEAKTGPVITELARRFDPALALASIPLALGGEKTVGRLVGAWRTEAWRNGIALRNARGAARATVAQRIESTAVLRADAIVAATSYLPLVESSQKRDAYCAAHR